MSEGGGYDVDRQSKLSGYGIAKLPEAFGLASGKSWYPHLFNTAENLDYVGPMPDSSYYGVDQMSNSERKDFLSWYEAWRGHELFDNTHARAAG